MQERPISPQSLSSSGRQAQITNLLLKPLSLLLRFEGNEAVALRHAGAVRYDFRGLDIAEGRENLSQLRFAGASRNATYENTVRYQRTEFRRSHRKTRGRGRARGRTRPLRTTGRSRALYNKQIKFLPLICRRANIARGRFDSPLRDSSRRGIYNRQQQIFFCNHRVARCIAY